jgi:hypothetical protein
MRHSLLLALNETVVVGKRRVKKHRIIAQALVAKGMDGDIPAIKEINDRVDGKIINLSAMDDGGLKLEDLIHMSYQAGKQSKVEKRPEPKLLPVIDLKAEKVE